MEDRKRFELRLEQATSAYAETVRSKLWSFAEIWLKRIEWCDEELAKLGEW